MNWIHAILCMNILLSCGPSSLGAEGFTSLFDGKSLDGWKPLPGGKWEVVDGVIVGLQEATEERHGQLLSVKQYGDFIVRLKFKAIEGNSGFYFRAQRVDDPAAMKGFQAEIDAGGGSIGGLYETFGRDWVVQPTQEVIQKFYRKKDWNEMTVTAIGGNVKVEVNGVTMADLKDDPGLRRGYFGLQLHGGVKMHVAFKDIEIKELAGDSHPLFDGKSFAGWEGNLEAFRIEDDAIVAGTLKGPNPQNEYLCTTEAYEDFELRLNVKVLGDKNTNSGVQIRSQRVPNSNEMIGYQADLGKNWGGFLYDERRHKMLALPDPEEQLQWYKKDQWNAFRIRCQGLRVQLWVDGRKTVDYTEPDETIPQNGVIGLQVHSGPPGEIWFKDIVLTRLGSTRGDRDEQ